jgi:UDP-N-acetylglucosamine transferase subunit ALG13
LIFLAVGTFGFERLVIKMDEIAARFDEEVIMQIGETKYIPQNAKYFDFCSEQDLKEFCRKASVVVTHGGVGLILDALGEGKPLVVVPRLRKCGEVIDDHQLYLVQELEKQSKLTAIYDVDKLEAGLRKISLKPLELVKDKRLVNALRAYIVRLEQRKQKPNRD